MAQPVAGPGFTTVGTALVDTNLTHDPRTGLPLVDLPPQYEGTLGELRGIVMHWIGPVNKVNANWTSSQPRTGIITDMAMYLLNEEGSVRRCLAARDMQEIYTTEEAGGLGIRMGGEHSVYMITPPEDQPYMIQCLEGIHNLQTGGRQLPVLQADRRSLRDILPLERPRGWELNMLPMHDKRALAELLARTNPAAPPPPPPPPVVMPPPVATPPPPPPPQPVGPDPNLLAELERTRRERDLAQRELDKLRADKAKDARNRQLREAFIRQEERLQSLQKQIIALQPEEQMLSPVPINVKAIAPPSQQIAAPPSTALVPRSPTRQIVAAPPRSRTPTHACHCRETTALIGQGPRARRETRVTCDCTPMGKGTNQPLLISEGRVGSPSYQRLRPAPEQPSMYPLVVAGHMQPPLSPPRTAYAVDSPRARSPVRYGSAVGDATARIYAEQERVEMHRAALLAQQRLEHERAQQYEHQRWLGEKMRRQMTRQLAPGRL